MAPQTQQMVTAQVIVRAVSGRLMDRYLTAETLSQYLPASAAAAQTQAAFASAGFEVSPLVANNFAITATAATYERFFKTKLTRTTKGGWVCLFPSGETQNELPLTALPSDLTLNLAAVIFLPPPDFGTISFN